MKNKTKLSDLINEGMDQLYTISFFEPFLTNYIADFKPEFTASMTEEELLEYLQKKDIEAMHEFCESIRRGLCFDSAKSNALHVLLSDVRR